MTGSRFANLDRAKAWAVVLALVAAIITGVRGLPTPSALPVTAAPAPSTASASEAGRRGQNEDLNLYAAIITRVAQGEAYYPAAADEHRKRHYPLRPFVTVRLPTLAAISARLGMGAMSAILYGLVLATLLAWRHRLRNQYSDPGRRTSALGLLLAGMVVAFWREFIVLHELWAGILLALAFGVHRPEKWLPSALIAGCALFIRELALPFVLLMGAFALWDRRWREAGVLAAIVATFAAALFIHARHVAAVTTASDLASPGWVAFSGWQGVVAAIAKPSVLRAVPDGIAAAVITLSLFGWLSWRSRAGLFGTLLFAGYGTIFAVLGRPDNFYWGFIIVPTFLIGLTFVPRAFADLHAALARKLDFAAA